MMKMSPHCAIEEVEKWRAALGTTALRATGVPGPKGSKVCLLDQLAA